jgi:tetratricopeptide (TPR) repeat protein
LLRAQGATGEEDELEKAAKEFGGHSLTLTLLGSYLKDVFGGDVQYRREVKRLTEDVQHGEQAHRVMAAYETQLRKPELAVLRMLGLFNRPADKQAIVALRAEPVIPGLTDGLQPLNRREWQQALANLRRAGLLAESDQFDTLDTHPLVREHFGQELRREPPDAWREGNKRLYEHFKRTAKEFPDKIEEMSPLYASVAHGCEAGLYQEAFDEVYWGRISRGEDYYSMDRLGALDSDLAVLTNFFVEPWVQPIAVLTETTKPRVLSLAGYCLKALGRLSEADTALQAALKANISQENWKDAADNADYLSGLSLLRGDPDKALKYAEEGVEQADQSGDYLQRVTNRSRRASVLHHAGRLEESKACFLAAEQIQQEQESHSLFLYSFRGFWYCDLLLDQGNYLEAITRAEQTLKRAREHGTLIDMAEDHLSLGRAYLLQAEEEHTGNYERASTHMTEAVDGLRQAHYQDHLISGLLARSKLRRVEGALEQAETDLKQAMSIAERSKMLPLLADCYLEYARLYLAQGQREKAGQSLATAKSKIKTIGYYRRDKEVDELEAKL